MPRSRMPLAIALPLVVGAGVASRTFPLLMPAMLGKYPGDALWALMIFVGVALVRPDLRPARLALVSLALCWLVEFSQLYQAPWINAIRATRLGHAALGSGFQAIDLLAYGVGVLAGVVLDRVVFSRLSAPAKDTAAENDNRSGSS
jgi:hypothetical protein